MRKVNSRRFSNEVNAGSMADIAFLLLIFFLVATTIANDKGLEVRLPPYYDGEPGSAANRNVLNILINAKDELLIEGKRSDLNHLHEDIVTFISNPSQSELLPRSPKEAIISIQNHTRTSYGAYTEVYSIIKKSYRTLRNQAALEQFGNSFELITREQRDIIRSKLPIKLSEAEPFSEGHLVIK